MADALIPIATPQLSAAINPLGAELTHLHDAEGRELMTNADPAFWTGHAPLLFPIVGRLNGDVLHIDGAEYPMNQHGFARRSVFTLVEHSEAQAVFVLEDSAESRAVYPFAVRAARDLHDHRCHTRHCGGDRESRRRRAPGELRLPSRLCVAIAVRSPPRRPPHRLR